MRHSGAGVLDYPTASFASRRVPKNPHSLFVLVVSTRYLGVQIDNALKWDHRVLELTKKLN